jgi:hypothetical protein
MALMLRARVRGVTIPHSVGKLSAFSPLSRTGWRVKLRPAHALRADWRTAATFFNLPRRQVTSVGISSRRRGTLHRRPRWQRSSVFTERCAWTH